MLICKILIFWRYIGVNYTVLKIKETGLYASYCYCIKKQEKHDLQKQLVLKKDFFSFSGLTQNKNILKSKISFNIFYELFSQILVWLTFLIDQSNYHENLSDQKSVQSLVCIGKRLKNNANTFVFIFLFTFVCLD